MKKIIASLFAAVLMSVGLVAVSGTTSPAAAVCGYPTAARTSTALEHDPVVSTGKPWKESPGGSLEVTGTVTAGTGTPNGSLYLTVWGPGYADTQNASLEGGSASFEVGGLSHPGRYWASAFFVPDDCSVYLPSFTVSGFNVKPSGGKPDKPGKPDEPGMPRPAGVDRS